MSQTELLFHKANLAVAAYASLQVGVTNSDTNITALMQAGMTEEQAKDFVSRYPVVVTQYNDTPAEGGLGTSFSATVFKDTSGNLSLAIRGTQETGDFFPTDATILTNGVGYDLLEKGTEEFISRGRGKGTGKRGRRSLFPVGRGARQRSCDAKASKDVHQRSGVSPGTARQ